MNTIVLLLCVSCDVILSRDIIYHFVCTKRKEIMMSIGSNDNYNGDSLHLHAKEYTKSFHSPIAIIILNEPVTHKLFVLYLAFIISMGSKQKPNNLHFFSFPFWLPHQITEISAQFSILLSWKLWLFSFFLQGGILNCGRVDGTDFANHFSFVLDSSSGFDGTSLVYPYKYCFVNEWST